MLKASNGYLAVEPFKEMVVQSQTKNGFATITQKVALLTTNIVFGSERYPSGKIVVDGAIIGQPYAKKTYELDGKRFVLIPESDVRLWSVDA